MYKRLLSILMALLITALLVPANTVLAANETAVVSVSLARMRKNPKTTSKILFKLKKNTKVTVTGKSGSWYKVKYSKKTGYILKKSLKLSSSDASTTEINVNKTLKKGNSGKEVMALQNALKKLGFYSGKISGKFDKATFEAVKSFQRTIDIKVDGIAGPKTLKLIKDIISENIVLDDDKPQVEINPEDIPPGAESPYQYKAELADWWTVGNTAFPSGAVATVVDVRTGLVWKTKRISGSESSHHADCAPLTKTDTDNLKKKIGGYTWNRRPILVTYNKRTFAASMNFMPHGGSGGIAGNGFPGHFCIHFLNSKTHGGNSKDPDHQRCVKEAYESKYALGNQGNSDGSGQEVLSNAR